MIECNRLNVISLRNYTAFSKEVENLIRQYKCKHIKGEVFTAKSEGLTWMIDTSAQKDFQFVGQIRRTYGWKINDTNVSYLTIEYSVPNGRGPTMLGAWEYSSYKEAICKEVTPIFSVIISILNFVSKKRGIDWRTEIALETNLRYFENSFARMQSTLEISTSNILKLFAPETDIFLHIEMYKNNPLYKELKSFFSKYDISPYATRNTPEGVNFNWMTEDYLLLDAVQENILKNLCNFFKVKELRELQETPYVTHSFANRDYTEMKFDIKQRKKMVYDETVDMKTGEMLL